MCQVLLTHIPDATVHSTPPINTGSLSSPPLSARQANSSSVKLDPDTVLPDTTRSEFQQLLQSYNEVFYPTISGYNRHSGRADFPSMPVTNWWSYNISSMNLNSRSISMTRSSWYYCGVSKSFIPGPEAKRRVLPCHRLCRCRTLQQAATIPSPRC